MRPGLRSFQAPALNDETGSGDGAGYSVNVPLPPEADDDLFLHAFDRTVPLLIDAFKPDILVTQLGVDTFRTDPLAHLNCTSNGFSDLVQRLSQLSDRWVALGGGGYDLGNVARAWTLAWAIMNNVEAPEEMPQDFFEQHRAEFDERCLRDRPFHLEEQQRERMKKETDRVIAFVQERILPALTRR